MQLTDRVAGSLDTPVRELIEAVGQLMRAVRCADHRRLWPDIGLRRSDAGLLRVLELGGELRTTDIAHKLAVDGSVVSRQLAVLEHEGLVTRRPDPKDARASLTSLSEEGRQKLAELYGYYAAQARAVLGDITDDELRIAATVLHKIATTLTPGADIPGARRVPGPHSTSERRP